MDFIFEVIEGGIHTGDDGLVLQECGDFTWMVPDCEEFVGVTHRR